MTTPARGKFALLLLMALLAPAPARAQARGFLENPPAHAGVSGIGLVSGWHCTARRVEILIEGDMPFTAAVGSQRPDTEPICGRADTGFVLLYNWGRLAPGPHAVRVVADGVELERRTVTVVSLGGEFLTGKAATATLNDFPSTGRSVVLEWRESLQGFAVREVRDDAPTLNGRWNGANLERRSQCSSPQNDGNRGAYGEHDIFSTDTDFGLRQSTLSGLTCDYVGRWEAAASGRRVAGTLQCSDGKRGDFTSTGVLVTRHEMSLNLAIRLHTTETCAIEAVIGGSRF